MQMNTPEKSVRMRDVFGISRDVPLNYVVRPNIDNVLIDQLSRDHHLVIHGSSKQGKTCLRKNCLNDGDYIVVTCLNKWVLSDLYAAILKQAGYEIQQSQKKSVSGRHKVEAKFTGEGGIPLLAKVEGEGGYGFENQNGSEVLSTPLELDFEDPNDVIKAFGSISFSKFIVLEDFHYLPIDTQKNFSFALKAFHENSKLCFIVIGVWREQDRLIAYNGDLTSRVVSIDADKWSEEQLADVIGAGEALLNIQFDTKFKTDLIKSSYESVNIVQQACYLACDKEGLHITSNSLKTIGKDVDARSLVKEVVDAQKARYIGFLTNFADGFQSTALAMYRWILYPLLRASAEELEQGIRLTDLSRIIKSAHPQGAALNNGNLTQALQNAASLQVQKEIRPIIIDYDQTNRRLNIVDRGFLIWLNHQKTSELLDMIDLPTN